MKGLQGMKSTKLIYSIAINRSKRWIVDKYGIQFWHRFKDKSDEWLKRVLPEVPDLGDSIFAFNFDFCPAYIAWYKAFMESELSSDEASEGIWTINEQLIAMLPGWIMPLSKRLYLNGFRKKAAKHAERSRLNQLHPYDWKIVYREISANTFEIDITECGMLKLGRDFDALGMFPMICRMDYLFAHYMGNGFERTKTLADGDECCNCRYHLIGSCDWPPTGGFYDHK